MPYREASFFLEEYLQVVSNNVNICSISGFQVSYFMSQDRIHEY